MIFVNISDSHYYRKKLIHRWSITGRRSIRWRTRRRKHLRTRPKKRTMGKAVSLQRMSTWDSSSLSQLPSSSLSAIWSFRWKLTAINLFQMWRLHYYTTFTMQHIDLSISESSFQKQQLTSNFNAGATVSPWNEGGGEEDRLVNFNLIPHITCNLQLDTTLLQHTTNDDM